MSGLQAADTVMEDGTQTRYPIPLLGNAVMGKVSIHRLCRGHTQQVTHEGVSLTLRHWQWRKIFRPSKMRSTGITA